MDRAAACLWSCRAQLTLAALFAITATPVAAHAPDARYARPVERYGHFAPGRPHEYAALAAPTGDGRTLVLDLPDDEVFEDVAPRRVRMGPSQPDLWLVIVSQRDLGSRLALVGIDQGRLAIVAESQPTGRANRWLNPVGVADLDGDGRIEIAAVTTPHIGGTLRLYHVDGRRLVEIAALDGFSNHVYGSSELRLSLPAEVDGHVRLLVPDAARRSLRLVGYAGGALTEVGRCRLDRPLAGPVTRIAPSRIAVGSGPQRRVIALDTCVDGKQRPR